MAQPGDVVIVSGPPGSGKSTVASQLSAESDRAVHLESDWFFRWIRSGFVAPHLPEAHEQNVAVLDIVADAAAGYAEAGYTVFWDGVVGPWSLGQVARRLAGRGVPCRYLVVRADRATALSRVRQRDGTTETSGAATMWDQFAELGDYEDHVIDASGPIDGVIARTRVALVSGGLGISVGNRPGE